MPGLGGPGMMDPSGPPPAPTDPGSMAMLAAALQGGGGPGLGGPGLGGGDPAGGGDPLAALGMGGAPPGPGAPGDQGDQGGSDLLSGMSATDHIRAAIKHLMMAMTESGNDEESHGIVKGMAALHGILAGRQKADATVTAAGGTPAGG
jgi:Spy/CpxP family protein refolding chaperone